MKLVRIKVHGRTDTLIVNLMTNHTFILQIIHHNYFSTITQCLRLRLRLSAEKKTKSKYSNQIFLDSQISHHQCKKRVLLFTFQPEGLMLIREPQRHIPTACYIYIYSWHKIWHYIRSYLNSFSCIGHILA